MKKRHERLIHPWSPEHFPFAVPQPSDPARTPLRVPSRAQLRRMKKREQKRQYYWRHREELLEKNRQWREENADYRRAYDRQYRQANRNKILAYQLNLRSANPEWVPMEVRQAQGRDLEEIVMTLRREGKTLLEIAQITGKSWSGCQHAWDRAMRRLGMDVGEEERRQQRERDALLLSTYHLGMTWEELARKFGYRAGNGARMAYAAACRRAGLKPLRKQDYHCISEELVLATYGDGMTWRELGRRLGCSDVGARKAYYRALDRATRPNQQQSA